MHGGDPNSKHVWYSRLATLLEGAGLAFLSSAIFNHILTLFWRLKAVKLENEAFIVITNVLTIDGEDKNII